jgi:xanthine dehydrogenase accessory factor
VSLSARVADLAARRVPFVHATVVRAQEPASARAGDDAVVLADGTMEGFVGGQCAQGSVRTAALGALRDGRSLLLRVLPEDGAPFPETPGAQVVVNPCLSGGALEIFLEPMLPPPLLEILGDTPITAALVRLAEVLGWATRPLDVSAGPSPGATAVVVGSHGNDEPAALRAALAAGVGYVALVASPRRGTAVLDELGLDAGERARIKTPAGLDIGARSAPEIALSILAELIERLRRGELRVAAAEPVAAPAQALDPVCGMTVTVTAGTPHLNVDGQDVWFCGTGCRDRFLADARR